MHDMAVLIREMAVLNLRYMPILKNQEIDISGFFSLFLTFLHLPL